MKMKWLAGVYILILVMIVFLADQKAYQFLFRPVRNLPYGDKAGHFILMGLFSLILNAALSCRTLRVWKLNLLFGSLIVAIVVTLEEFSQLFIRYRSFDPVDLYLDYAGIFLFGQLAYWMGRGLPKSSRKI
ncbi:MAG TPA: VanZ family protein [Pyrinomonadaceae bacterium]|jgi:VanZ family protein